MTDHEKEVERRNLIAKIADMIGVQVNVCPLCGDTGWFQPVKGLDLQHPCDCDKGRRIGEKVKGKAKRKTEVQRSQPSSEGMQIRG